MRPPQNIGRPCNGFVNGEIRQHPVERLRELIEAIPVCLVNTISASGFIHSRPMAYLQMDSTGELTFFTRADSIDAEEIIRHNAVCVTFSDHSRNRYVTVSGHARLVRDRALVVRLFTPAMKRWFPEGPEDLSLRLLAVNPVGAEYWNSPSGLTLLLEIA